MAKETYLSLTNIVLRRLGKATISDVSTASGIQAIVTDAINQAIIEIYKDVNWYSLYTERTFNTVADTGTYAVASDFGRTLGLYDETNDRQLYEETLRNISTKDPNRDSTGTPRVFSLEGSNYRLFEIPAGVYTIRDMYWKLPAKMTANADEYDLPIEVENMIIWWAWKEGTFHLNNFEKADRLRLEFEDMLESAKRSNRKKIDRLLVFKGLSQSKYGIDPVRMPSNFEQPFYR